MGSDKWQWRGRIISTFFDLLQEPSARRGLTMHPPFPPILFQKSDYPPPSVWPNSEFTLTAISEKSLLICIESYWVSLTPTGRLLMVTLQHFAND